VTRRKPLTLDLCQYTHTEASLPRPSIHERSAFDHLVLVLGLLLQMGLRDAQHGQSLAETRKVSDPAVAAEALYSANLTAVAARLEQYKSREADAAVAHRPGEVSPAWKGEHHPIHG
jgi:hypothetical protein